jgi:adenylate cyclase class IV
MPRNIEVKARVADILAFDALKKQALELSFEWDKLHQTDTFYESKSGRVKVRESSSESETWCELIWYDRSDSEGPKCSNYHITSIAPKDVLALKHTLRNACGGEQCVVKKTRHVYLVGQTRVHCDEVDELGYFAELEVVLTPRQNEQDGIQIAQTLATRLRLTDFVKGAYADLLPRKQVSFSVLLYFSQL